MLAPESLLTLGSIAPFSYYTAILNEMELKNKGSQNLATPLAQEPNTKYQLSIFDAHTETFESIRKELDAIDINNLTPVEALMKLQAIKKKLN
jgi:DNA mismatch repair protein MutS